ncbi:hypothetical protein M9M90_03120 [Phenylobacterium sp. LH3H17]|uniref:hypothetical protein n=1 Tax=Phenylobacterium sp. LH3H17 TaxID=2903901 RepID=UPI0020C95C18|nr:hypothetical protein [Phenylobacterium sp. LH3H17]UTP40181.1 hypothetical protein M9M90_03120 [Phenylobacterium sp. LH3H17]
MKALLIICLVALCVPAQAGARARPSSDLTCPVRDGLEVTAIEDPISWAASGPVVNVRVLESLRHMFGGKDKGFAVVRLKRTLKGAPRKGTVRIPFSYVETDTGPFISGYLPKRGETYLVWQAADGAVRGKLASCVTGLP